MTESIGIESLRAAQARTRDQLVRTPLIEVSDHFATLNRSRGKGREPLLGRWWLKLESLQHGGSFKIRGVLSRVTSWLEAGDAPAGLVAYSSGNHGGAVALAAEIFGLPAVIAVPESVPAVKLERIEEAGAEVILAGTTSAHRKAAADAVVAERGFRMVEPFDDPQIISGQGGVGLEIAEDLPDVTDVVVPVGGGGLLTGVSLSLTRVCPGARVHAVEPEGCDAFRRSRESGRKVTIEPAPSIADGLRPVAPGTLVVEHAAPLVSSAVTVGDAELLEAMRLLQHPLHVVSEPSGAAPLAALLSGRIASDDATRGVLIISGGNADWSVLAPRMWNGAR